VTKEDVLTIVYRSLRDTFSEDVLYTEYNKNKNEIYISIKDKKISYPFEREMESNQNSFEEVIFILDKDGIRSASKDIIKKKQSILEWIKSKI
jgi:hypothetical protein